MSSNLSVFSYFSPVKFSYVHFLRSSVVIFVFLPVKPYTVKVNFFFIVSLFGSFRSLICIFLLMSSALSVWIFLNK